MGLAAREDDVTAQKQRFAPLPLRAATYSRLAARHWRALHIIAAHDRLGKNGAACYASQRRLAKLAECGEARLSDTLSDLRQWGYIASAIHPEKRRLRVHQIVYNEDDENFWRRDTFPIGKASRANTFPKRGSILSQNEEKKHLS